ncbi:uncharacterized protein LOC119270839 isoform X1 [Triticum dicoccoides]|uniref:uncharacterized protein LOC119270839 isoform X1 n=1 Tax=Triticum dicoccoides TaxID=85692 RepID=UPI00188DE403|nr:uncharacterized protein LOC119270839 isoform X1 [Triticum dicoccoides]
MEGRSLALPSSHSYAASLSSRGASLAVQRRPLAVQQLQCRLHPDRRVPPSLSSHPSAASLPVDWVLPRRPDLIPTPASRLTLLSPSQSSSSHCRVKSWRTTTDLRRGRPKKGSEASMSATTARKEASFPLHSSSAALLPRNTWNVRRRRSTS